MKMRKILALKLSARIDDCTWLIGKDWSQQAAVRLQNVIRQRHFPRHSNGGERDFVISRHESMDDAGTLRKQINNG